MYSVLSEVAARHHPAVLAVATIDFLIGLASGVAAVILGAEVPDGALVAGVLFVLGTGTGVIGWALVLLVKLSNVVTRLEANDVDHERRIERLEATP